MIMRVEKQCLEANIQTRVYREFLLAANTRVEIRTWVELGLKTDSCNSISLCKETHIIIVERRAALSRRVGHH